MWYKLLFCKDCVCVLNTGFWLKLFYGMTTIGLCCTSGIHVGVCVPVSVASCFFAFVHPYLHKHSHFSISTVIIWRHTLSVCGNRKRFVSSFVRIYLPSVQCADPASDSYPRNHELEWVWVAQLLFVLAPSQVVWVNIRWVLTENPAKWPKGRWFTVCIFVAL